MYEPTNGYVCVNPITGWEIHTQFMGEADFWAAMGYEVKDYYGLQEPAQRLALPAPKKSP